MSSSVSYHISNLLEKMTSTDKDFRFMATNDLMSELQKDSIKLDDDCEKKVVRMLLKLLEDKNGEVQNLAVKCLGPLVNKVKEIQVETIVDTLCSNMISNNEQLRDISSIGLKTVIAELSPNSTSLVSTICKKITGRLAAAISQHEDMGIRLEALEILSDLLNRFGSLLVSFHANIQDALIPQLLCQRLAVRKRAITALSYLTMSCSQQLYNRVIEFLIEELTTYVNSKDINSAKTYIQCITAISRQSGHRFGEHLEKVMPLITKFASIDIKDKKPEEVDELKEVCLQAYESFVRRCPKEISSHVSTITNVCLQYLSYDPNYNYDSDGTDDEDMEMDNEEEEADTDGSYSDDDDMSWKVRRASAKTLEALISTRHELVVDFYRKVSPELISRYKEREENVKVDVFNAYIALLKQTRTVIGTSNGCDNSMEFSNSVATIVGEQVPAIVKSLHKQLREKSIKTRQSSFALLSELVNVLPGALTDHISNLIPGILYSLSDKNSSSNMKIDTLAFLNVLLKNHNPEVFHKHIHILLPAVINAVSDSFYKITSEALLVLAQITKVIRPLELNYNISSNFNFMPFIQPIYESTIIKLRAADIDQEVKERAITCMGQIIYTFGDQMHSELQVSLPLLLDRLRNEITRLTCVKAITKIASSQFKLNLNPLLPEAFPVLASFLRKNQRALKLSSLQLIDTFVKNYSEYLSPETIGIILNEVPPLINESDLHISQLTLNMLTSLIRSHLAFLAIIPQTILPEALVLVRSPLLQGSALNSMLEFFQAIVQNSFPGLDYEELVARLTQPITQPNRNQTIILHKQAFHSIAKCISAISIIDNKRAINTVKKLLADIRSHKESDSIQLYALLAVGEIGKTIDLSAIKDLKDVIIESFNSSSEEVKSAASFCLGSISVGNLTEYLPFVLSEIESRQKRQYLLLHSLKEIISCQSANPQTISVLEPHLDSIWKLLLNHCECPEEGTRNVVAECLGKLTLIDPIKLLPRLQQYLLSDSPLARSTVVTAMKFTISDQPQKIDALLRNNIGDFLKTLQDPDINVRRVALVAFNSAAHNKPSLIRDLLDSILPQLYNETKIRKELIREVEMGPFKHTVDDGLDIRKAAFECMYTLLDSCLDRIDIFEFLNHVEDGLRDHYDIKMLTYLMLVRLSTLCPSAVLQRLERLVDPLKSTCVSKVKANAVKQEFEKQDELKRSAMRAFLALLAIPDADKNILMTDFLSQIKSTQELSALYETIQKDSTVSNEVPMDCN